MILSRLPPWSDGCSAAALMLGVIGVQSGSGSIGPTLSVALAFGAISVLVGTGKMVVIASGPGIQNLSVPSVLTLAAYISMTVMGRTGGMISVGIVAAHVVWAVAGRLNCAAIRLLRLPQQAFRISPTGGWAGCR